jgi:hypothetical protein
MISIPSESFTLNMKAVCSSETSVLTRITRRHLSQKTAFSIVNYVEISNLTINDNLFILSGRIPQLERHH